MDPMTYIFFPVFARYILPGIASVTRLGFGLGQCSAGCKRSDKDADGKRLNITLFFTRRYLRNEKSYRDNSKSVLKSKVPRF